MPDPLALAAAQIVQHACGKSPAEVIPLRRGVMTFKFVVALPSGERYVVRFYPDSRYQVVCYEGDILRRCREAGLAAPEPLADSRSGPPAPQSYLMYRMIEGVPAADRYHGLGPAARARLAGQLVTALHRLAELPVSGYGDLLDGVTARFPRWLDFLHDSVTEGIRCARQQQLLPSALLRDLETISSAWGSFPADAPGRLAWGDISLENLLLDAEGNVAGMVDFEGVLAAGPLLNLGYCYAAGGEFDFFLSLCEAWPTPIDDEARRSIDLYAILRVLRIARFAHQPLPTGGPRTPLAEMFPGFSKALQKEAKRCLTKKS